MKKLVFVSNYLSHYSKTISEAFMKIYGSDYLFIAETPFNQKRLSAGFHDMNNEPYVLRAYESPESNAEAQRMINEAECVIIGGLPVSYVSSRLQTGKITFMQSERFFKGPLGKDAVRFVKYSIYSGGRFYARNPQSKFFLLCASAFAAWDYNTCGLFRGKAYRWGYFPDAVEYDDIDGLISRKKKASILWAGRFLDWKHPDFAVKLAKNLCDMGFDFNMKIIGSGEMQEELSRMIETYGLGGSIELTGAVPTEQVRAEMENSQIFIATSDRGEGWGVVINEAMNSGCAVIGGSKMGAAPYLIKDGHNGLIFCDRDIDDLTVKVSGLLREPERMSLLGRNAYETVTGEWSPRNAAERFSVLSEALRNSEEPVSLWENGPGSVAPVI